MERLTDEQISEKSPQLPEWKLDGKFISRRYKFSSFKEAMSFVNEVAEIAETENHHPFISIDYKMVTLKLTSWHAGGLTSLDFSEAKQFDAKYEEI